MSPSILLDTGPLVALLDRRDQHHLWSTAVAARYQPPWYSCEPVITEASFLLRHLPDAVQAILGMLGKGIVRIEFRLEGKDQQVAALMRRYRNLPMSLADACLVSMSESQANCRVLTLDGDFRVYRRHGRQKIPLVIPPEN